MERRSGSWLVHSVLSQLMAAFRRMNRPVSHLIAGWRTGLSRPVLILQGGNALNYFGYGLVLPFEIIYLHQIRGFSTSTAGLVQVDDLKGKNEPVTEVVEGVSRLQDEDGAREPGAPTRDEM